MKKLIIALAFIVCVGCAPIEEIYYPREIIKSLEKTKPEIQAETEPEAEKPEEPEIVEYVDDGEEEFVASSELERQIWEIAKDTGMLFPDYLKKIGEDINEYEISFYMRGWAFASTPTIEQFYYILDTRGGPLETGIYSGVLSTVESVFPNIPTSEILSNIEKTFEVEFTWVSDKEVEFMNGYVTYIQINDKPIYISIYSDDNGAFTKSYGVEIIC